MNRMWQKIEDLIVIQISSDETYVCPCVTGPSAAVDTWGSIFKSPVASLPDTKNQELIVALMAQIACLCSKKFRDNNTGMHGLKSVP